MMTASETRPLVHGQKQYLAISSRSTDFNVQISAVNIHSHYSQMFGQNYGPVAQSSVKSAWFKFDLEVYQT